MSNDGNIELNEKELEQCKEDAIAEFKQEISKNFLASMTTQLHSLIVTMEGLSNQVETLSGNIETRIQELHDKII
tara:strand:- start:1177 stop:1401 length:225 start_codon:yes stop_codon:yes gene_type:complete